MNNKTKLMIKYAAIITLIITLIMSLICLVNYYKYVGIINKLRSEDIDLLTKFDLQEQRDSRLYAVLSSLIWTAYITIITTITNIASLLINKEAKKINKIR